MTEAQRLFAARGFDGVSLDAISDALGLTKQAVIHHFGTKQRLYAVILQQVARRCSASVEIEAPASAGTLPEDALCGIYDRYCAYGLAHPQDMALIARALLDAPDRPDHLEQHPLEPLLLHLVATMKSTQKWRDAPEPQALSLACQMLGAVSWFVVSEPLLTRAFGEGLVAETADIFPGEFRRSVRRLVQD